MTGRRGPIPISVSTWRTTAKGCRAVTINGAGVTIRLMQRRVGGTFYSIILQDRNERGAPRQSWSSLRTNDESEALELGRTILREIIRERRPTVVQPAAASRASRISSRSVSSPRRPSFEGSRVPMSPGDAMPERRVALVSAMTLGDLWDAYYASEAFRKLKTCTQIDRSTRARILLAGLKRSLLIDAIDREELDRYSRLRKEGVIAYISERRGSSSAPRERIAKPVGQRSVEADLQLLRLMIFWAMETKSRDGVPLLSANPMIGYEIEEEMSPRRDIADVHRFSATLEAIATLESAAQTARARGHWSRVRMVLRLAETTGRRVGSIRQLTAADLRFGEDAKITWRANINKNKKPHVTYMPNAIRTELARYVEEMPATPQGWLFPRWDARHQRPLDAPMTTDQLRYWLARAEAHAGVQRGAHGGFHSYRRKWATERKDFPWKDVMTAMGIEDAKVFADCYMHPDPNTLHRVIDHPTKLDLVDTSASPAASARSVPSESTPEKV